ncbi:MAG: hypothetical protein JST16_08105 [Bdellovibrionales bacterium]|nr:hypothetical protein [Bdellovibrionales bacterium]
MKESTDKAKGNWGGRREGAGRPKTSPFVAHTARPELGQKLPARIVVRLRSGWPSLRNEEIFETFAKAASRARRFGIRIIEFTILPKAIHLICEFKDKEELERSFKSLNTTLAIALKKLHRKESNEEHKGPVFLGRFHMELLDSPEKVKAALTDVLTLATRELQMPLGRDRYSSAVLFDAWKPLLGSDATPSLSEPSTDEDAKRIVRLVTASPQFWLTKTGWRKA